MVLKVVVVGRLIPETKGRSLEEMDFLFGVVSAEQREEHIRKEERSKSPFHQPWLIYGAVFNL